MYQLLSQTMKMLPMKMMIMFLLLIFTVKSDPLLHNSCDTVCICDSYSVVCQGRQLDNIPNDLNPIITRLDVQRNKIKYVSNMEAYNRLEYLDLSENEIVEIKPHCFRESSEMLTLNLRHNRIGTVDHNDLEGLTHLATLNMAENSIDNITDRAFTWSQRLQSINLASNKLDGLHRNTFDGSVRNTLRGLDLSNNLFTNIPGAALAGLEDLTSLDFSGNPLGTVDSNAFHQIGGNLRELKLSGCQIYSISASAFNGLGTLKSLDLSNNGLTETPNRAFNSLGMLEELRIGRNKITDFGGRDFWNLKKLKHFSIEGCNVRSLTISQGLFGENTNLESITIKCPNLQTISDKISWLHLSVLKTLSLHGSGLQTIPEHLVNYYDIKHLDLSSNPLQCDCRLKFIFNLLVQPSPVEVAGVCAGPERVANTNIGRLREKDYECSKSKKNGSLVTGLSITAGVAILAIVLGFICWKKKLWNVTLFKPKKKRMSANFSGDKKDIKVLQNKDIDASEGFLQLPGLQNYSETGQTEPLYAEVAEVTETVPKYNIPLPSVPSMGTVNCPDVKISVL